MGSYQSNFQKPETRNKKQLDPSKATWLTIHADETGLAVVEVERLWNRFKQLGVDEKGVLPQKTVQKTELSKDPFLKNIFEILPKENDGCISFFVFLRFIQWLEASDDDTKLKGIFNLVNNGKDLNDPVLNTFFKRMYPDCTDDELVSIVEVFMNQLDDKKTGYITQSQFVTNIKRNVTSYQLSEFLRFDVIPNQILDEVNMQPSLNGSRLSLHNIRDDVETQYQISDEQMNLIAKKIINKKWEDLLYKLGYLESDIEVCKVENEGNIETVIVDLLKQWRDQDPYLSTKFRLKRYLEECGLIDAAILLD